MQANSRYIRIFFVWSVISLVLNFGLSSIDLTTIGQSAAAITTEPQATTAPTVTWRRKDWR